MVENKIYIFRQQAAKSSHDKDLEDLESWANAWGAQYIFNEWQGSLFNKRSAKFAFSWKSEN